MMRKNLYKILAILMALIVAGSFICCDMGSGIAPLTKFFIIFFGAVIGLQSSPAALMFIGLIKGVQADDRGTTKQPLSRNGVNPVKVRKILIVDNDGPNRKQLAQLFASSHYEVETTTSAAYAIAKIVQKNEPIVILGDSFEEVITSADVVALMRKCNKNLQIILVSDDSSLETLRRMSGDGAFYLAVKPQNPEDNEELRSAVECAVEGYQPAMS